MKINTKATTNNKNMMEVKFKSPIAYYAVGFLWLFYALLLPMYRIIDYLILILLSVLLYSIVNKLAPMKTKLIPIPMEPITSNNREVDSIIKEGLSYLRQIKEANDKIPHVEISKEISRMEESTDKIFRYIAKHPNKASDIRKFMNYYLPTLLKLLNSYINCQEQGIEGSNIKNTMKKIEDILSTIADTFEKQLDNLFADEALDISTDITVLESILAGEGLSQDPFRKEGN